MKRRLLCLRQETGTDRPILVQPYGLTVERRRALLQAAAATGIRLSAKENLFHRNVGSAKGCARLVVRSFNAFGHAFPRHNFVFSARWSIPRQFCRISSSKRSKASNSFPTINPMICRDCWRIAPLARFRVTRRDSGWRCLSSWRPGYRRSPTIPPGRAIFLARHLPELLVQKGDIGAFAATICRILQLNPDSYEELSTRSVEAAAEFSWPDIAEATLSAYRGALKRRFRWEQFCSCNHSASDRLAAVLASCARCSRARRSPGRAFALRPGEPRPGRMRFILHSRPAWGRIEHSRFAAIPNAHRAFFCADLSQAIEKSFAFKLHARALHAVPHAGLDFAQVHAVARELALPFFISLHDDLAYTAASAGAPAKEREAAMRAAWREASGRFVISEALGREYCERYGARDYQVVTDGLSELTPPRADADSSELRIYFMGLFHMGYERNLRALARRPCDLRTRTPLDDSSCHLPLRTHSRAGPGRL